MLAIRMRRVGAKKSPFFRVVVADHREARDGAFVEILGNYYPRSTPERLELDLDRVNYWLSKGARPSDTVRTLMARQPAPAAPVAAE
jgi:small subunit ribosomal protein S16